MAMSRPVRDDGPPKYRRDAKLAECTRCVSTGRKCDGYTIDPASSAAFVPLDQPTDSPAPPGLPASPEQRRVFRMLSTKTINQVSGGFDHEFWARDVLQATRVYPAIWHGAIALAAMHQYMKANAAADRAQAVDCYTFALTQHRISVGYIMKLKSESVLSYGEKESLLLATMLYAAICCLEGHRKDALIHIKAAMNLFADWRFWEAPSTPPYSLSSTATNTPSPNTTASSTPTASENTSQPRKRRRKPAIKSPSAVLRRESLMQLMLFFYRQLNDFEESEEELLLYFNSQIRPSTDPFTSVTEAYFYYLPIHMGEKIPAEDDPPQDDDSDTPKVTPSLGAMLTRRRRLAQWKERFRPLAASSRTMSTPHELRCCQILKILATFEGIFQDVMAERTPRNWARHRNRWPALVAQIEAHLAAEAVETGILAERDSRLLRRAEPVFSFSHSILEVLRMVGFICRDGSVRRRVISLLRQYPRIDGVWDSQAIALEIEFKMRREQEGPLGGGGAGAGAGGGGGTGASSLQLPVKTQGGGVRCDCQCVPDIFVCMDHRVGTVEVDFLQDRVIRIRAQTGYESDCGLPGVVRVFPLR